MTAANLNPEAEYFCIVEPGNKELKIKLFDTRQKAKESKEYKKLKTL
jgi:hypothetical protein